MLRRSPSDLWQNPCLSANSATTLRQDVLRIYFAQSQGRAYHYGSTQDLETRLREHNRGKVSYTKGHRPYELYYSEQYPSRSEAQMRERYCKSIAGYRWLREQAIIV